MIINWIKKKLEEIEQEELEKNKNEATALQKQLELALEELKEHRDLMFEMHCPIENGFCNDMCIHFYEGKTRTIPDPFDDYIHVVIDYPKCKLWRKQ